MRKNSVKQIEAAAVSTAAAAAPKLLFHFSKLNLPTTFISPDTIMVLKCGASAETVCIFPINMKCMRGEKRKKNREKRKNCYSRKTFSFASTTTVQRKRKTQ
jgi:hypothetical protein